MGLLINLESVDRAGKTTQVPLVVSALREAGLSVATMKFPDTPSRNPETTPAHYATGKLIDAYLLEELALFDGRGSIMHAINRAVETKFGDLAATLGIDIRLDEADRAEIAALINEHLIQVVFSVNRRENMDRLAELLDSHDIVVLDRHLSAYTFAVANKVSRVLVNALEGDLPQPDLNVLLDIDPAVARTRRSEDAPDLYERNAELQSEVRRIYHEMIADDLVAADEEGRAARWLRIDATQTPDTIAAAIVSGVLALHGRRSAKAA